MGITGTSITQNTILQLILNFYDFFIWMSATYRSIIVKVPGLKVKGDDTSAKMSEMIEEAANFESSKGWKLIQITPALVRDGSLQKVILTMERYKVN